MAEKKTDWKTVLAWGAVVAGGGVLLYAGAKASQLGTDISTVLKNMFFAGGNPNPKQAAATVKSATTAAAASGQKPNFSDTQYSQWADDLEKEMLSVPTDSNSVLETMSSMLSNLDLLKLVAAFGTRDYAYLTVDKGNMNLGQWIRTALSSDDVSNLNSMLSINLSDAIPFQF